MYRLTVILSIVIFGQDNNHHNNIVISFFLALIFSYDIKKQIGIYYLNLKDKPLYFLPW
jgi:hypothetical protein